MGQDEDISSSEITSTLSTEYAAQTESRDWMSTQSLGSVLDTNISVQSGDGMTDAH